MGQRFFALFRAADVFRAPPRAPFFFRPAPFGFEPARRRVATSSCRCSDPIMRPSDSAERSRSDSFSRDRSRAGCAGIDFLAIQTPFSRARCP